MYPNPQEVIPLPPNPNLDQYKKQAKDLVKACQSGDRNAVHAWAAVWLATLARLHNSAREPGLPEWIHRQVDQVAGFAQEKLLPPDAHGALATAQFLIARTHGFLSWPKFAKHIEALARASSPISNFESAADAIVSGEVSRLERLLREDPELIRARSTREHGAALLHYVSANGVEGYRQKTPKNAVQVAEILLNAGAEVEAEADVYGGGATTLGLVATSIHPFLAGLQNPLIQILLDHGARIDHPESAGNRHSAVIGCLANGRGEAAVYLAERGARLGLAAAAGVGRLDIVKSCFKEESASSETGSDVVQVSTASDRAAVSTGSSSDRARHLQGAAPHQLQAGFSWACEYGRKDVVEFLLDQAVDLCSGENTPQTALHLAAHQGQLEIIKLLLARGAPLEAKNVYGGTVLGQATWSVMHGDPKIDFVPTIEALLAAGANIEGAAYPTGNARVDKVLRRHGAK